MSDWIIELVNKCQLFHIVLYLIQLVIMGSIHLIGLIYDGVIFFVSQFVYTPFPIPLQNESIIITAVWEDYLFKFHPTIKYIN